MNMITANTVRPGAVTAAVRPIAPWLRWLTVSAPAPAVAPPFPHGLEWATVVSLRMDKQIGRPVLVDFWDFCRPNSLRALPYVKAWHERYAPSGLRVVSVHCSGFAPSTEPGAVRAPDVRSGIGATRPPPTGLIPLTPA